jgi:hypothetical protein
VGLSGSFRSLDTISLAPGSVDFFAPGNSKTPDKWFWQEWEDLKGMMTKPPTAVTHFPGHLGVFGLGEGGVLFYNSREVKSGDWGPWISLGGVLKSRAKWHSDVACYLTCAYLSGCTNRMLFGYLASRVPPW